MFKALAFKRCPVARRSASYTPRNAHLIQSPRLVNPFCFIFQEAPGGLALLFQAALPEEVPVNVIKSPAPIAAVTSIFLAHDVFNVDDTATEATPKPGIALLSDPTTLAPRFDVLAVSHVMRFHQMLHKRKAAVENGNAPFVITGPSFNSFVLPTFMPFPVVFAPKILTTALHSTAIRPIMSLHVLSIELVSVSSLANRIHHGYLAHLSSQALLQTLLHFSQVKFTLGTVSSGTWASVVDSDFALSAWSRRSTGNDFSRLTS